MALKKDSFLIHRLVAANSANNTLIQKSFASLHGYLLTNDSAAALFVRYYNKATTPVAGTDTPVLSITVPANSTVQAYFGEKGLNFDLGLGMAVTLLKGDADATAVVLAGDMLAHTFYR